MWQAVIKLILNVAQVVNSDKDTNQLLKVPSSLRPHTLLA
jgi:hypothetical protein